jgi:hypothetical protein
MAAYFGDVWLVRLLFQRMLAAIYLIAFIVVLRQFKPLLGERGLLPVPRFIERASFRDAPSLFCWRYSDRLLVIVGWTGLALSTAALLGVSEMGPIWLSMAVWLVLWFLYLSIVNVGQKFYGFGWESMLLEAGFFTAFMGSAHVRPSIIPILILRWMLFRTEFGAGLIKLRHDQCWRDLTCLYYHYETQPLPNPLSWYFHQLPKWLHRFSVVFSHFVQVIAPFGLFAPQPIATIAGAFIIIHQLLLIISGNYSWLNWLTVALGVLAFSDTTLTLGAHLHFGLAQTAPRPLWFEIVLYALGAAAIALSVKPALNLVSRNQLMNYSYNPFHLVNAYGAFGSVTRERYEIVLEGTDEAVLTNGTHWQEYGFKAKPDDPRRAPPQWAPYHLRLDWLVWFLPFSVGVSESGVYVRGYELWFMRLMRKLLENDAATIKLFRKNPFPDAPPRFIRALFYQYRYTTWQERKKTGAWWERRLIGTYLSPISLAQLRQL